jgi:CelD/BcsL family acetyltransferase involved in cellulose biosynthesis
MKKNKIKIRIVTKRSEAKELWLKFCKPKVVWDLWTIREIFFDVYKREPYFVVAVQDGNPVGMLPLWFNEEVKEYEWVGWWSEYNKPFTSDQAVLKLLLSAVKGKVRLQTLDTKTAKLFNNEVRREEDQFTLNLKKYNYSWNNFLQTLKKKKRQNLRRDIRAIDNLHPVIKYNRYADLKDFARLNIKQMERKITMYTDEMESIFKTDKRQIKFFRKLFKKSGKEYKARIITVLINKKVVGVDFCLIYKNTYIAMLGGLDINKASGIGIYMNYLDISDAIDHNCDIVDFMMEDHHWKKEWFKGKSRFVFERPELHKLNHLPTQKKTSLSPGLFNA